MNPGTEAHLSAVPPSGSGRIHEIKHDGFRTLLRIDRDNIRAEACQCTGLGGT
jgi:ATP-dependent DNA ligase